VSADLGYADLPERPTCDFHERHCLSRPTWRPRRGRAKRLRMPFARYASIRTVSESTLFGGSVHRMRSVFIRATNKALQSSERSLFLLERVDQVRNLRSRLMLEIRSDGAREAAAHALFHDLYAVAGYLLSFFSFAVLRLPSSIKLPGLRSGGRSAVARRSLRSPTNCAKAPRAFWPRQPPPVSLRSCLRGRLSSRRDVLGPSPSRKDLRCSEHRLAGAYAKHLQTFLLKMRFWGSVSPD
jgi:hypothetical protein